MFGPYSYLMQRPPEELEGSMPESLAMMVSFLLRQLRAARALQADEKLKAKNAHDEVDYLRNLNKVANKEIQRLTKELLELKEAWILSPSAKPKKRRKK